MENGASEQDAGDAATARTPPPPPEPSAAATLQSIDPSFSGRSDEPLLLEDEQWDITAISALGALRMLIGALQDLADSMGDVPPTPPVSRPTTPKKERAAENEPRRTSSPEASCSMTIGSPEAQPREPITVEVGVYAEDTTLQRAAIARRFFSKTAPAFSVSQYLLRMHHYCPHSPGVYLTAAVYCHRLCVADLMVPATNRTVHRLSLAAIRVAAKALEDNKWAQERFAGVGGVSRTQLMNLEVTLCFLLDFDLGVDAHMLAKMMFLLQQAGRQGLGACRKLGGDFRLRLKLPLRKRTNTFT
ncbi:hypothetical protein LTR36_010072 [Oleoguttula mirabilis]|uniref:Uncharacterized protein n=1 Tax=Oleoguttula mirabilis TaxID=1507867 RepID=A0AAV9JRC7_9PEZI|nr:hypothetical protein LTR36_010072 [Oleoguttula mirabilis]